MVSTLDTAATAAGIALTFTFFTLVEDADKKHCDNLNLRRALRGVLALGVGLTVYGLVNGGCEAANDTVTRGLLTTVGLATCALTLVIFVEKEATCKNISLASIIAAGGIGGALAALPFMTADKQLKFYDL